MTGASALPDGKPANHDNDVIASLLPMTVAELFEGKNTRNRAHANHDLAQCA